MDDFDLWEEELVTRIVIDRPYTAEDLFLPADAPDNRLQTEE